MVRHRSMVRSIVQAQRAAERQRAAQQRQRLAHEREQLRLQKEQGREEARLYAESRIAEVEWENEQLQQAVVDLENILATGLSVDSYVDLETLKKTHAIPFFDLTKSGLQSQGPVLSSFMPPDLSTIQKFMPGAKARHAAAVIEGRANYEAASSAYEAAIAKARATYDREVAELQAQIAAFNLQIDQFRQAVVAAQPGPVADYFAAVFEASVYPEDFPQHAKLAYVPESKQLVVEYDLPAFDIVPEMAVYKYVKARDEITTTSRPLTQRKRLYTSVIAQITLRTIHEVFTADRLGQVETIVFNGYVESIDRSIGRAVRTCVVTVRVTRNVFAEFDLSQVDPIKCLKSFASISTSPEELTPVRPVLEFNMVDPRFIEETDVLSTLDQRPNLMDLTPYEFEALIANLFSKMGLETRLTQASRDGGVDCVAYDPRPIFGGKVVIQAKRYKNTVGVSAVRDLWGTTQNEGASKGILVTTSGYGSAAFEFAKGKPLELLDGGNLLYLLAEHAGLEAKIEIPEGWHDPGPDLG